MATRAGNADVRAGQRERRLTVIECRGLPSGCRVASRARRGNTGLQMRRIVRVVEILRVTTVAISRRSLISPPNVT